MLAVCAIRPDQTIAAWNQHLEALSGLNGQEAVNQAVGTLPLPWSELLLQLIEGEEEKLLAVELNDTVSLNLYRTPLGVASEPDTPPVHLVIVENISSPQSLESRLFHKERLAFVGQVAAGVAHEIGNPITAIACLAQNMKLESEDSAMLTIAEQILAQTDRVSTILQSLAYFVHGNSQGKRTWKTFSVKECIDEAIQLLSLGNRTIQSCIINHCPDSLTVEGDAQRLSQVFVNIISNALDACPEDAHVDIDGQNKDNLVTVHVTDQGPGIPEVHLKSIFEPFYSTKEVGSGTGLGLAIAKTIINEHMGSIDVESPTQTLTDKRQAGQPGTRFSITLPGKVSKESIDFP